MFDPGANYWVTAATMKAVVYHKYGSPDVLQLAEVPRPVPADGEILVRVHAVSINGSDREGLTGSPWYARLRGPFRPGNKILGSDIAGRVEAVGRDHSEFKPGDDVFGELPGYHGGFAEYVCTHGRTLMLKPASLTFEQAAAIPQAGVIALAGIRDQGQVRPGQQVLINGAGGSAGCFAIQIARLCGATITGIDAADKFDFMRSLGAEHVIDYRTGFTLDHGRYDLILDLIAHGSIRTFERALRPGGAYYLVGGSAAAFLQLLLLGPWIRSRSGKRMRLLVVPQSRQGLMAITQLCEAGRIVPPIDRLYSLPETPKALRSVVEGRAKGKVVITM